MSYRQPLEMLRAYEPKRLVSSSDETDKDWCVMGVLLPSTRTINNNLSIGLVARHNAIVRDELTRSGMTLLEAERLQDFSDLCVGSPEQRYQYVVNVLTKYVSVADGQ